jgi:DNA polymerase III beta subunit
MMPKSTKESQSMNLETDGLKAALERLCLVVPKKGTLPVLENLRWRVVKGHLELTATDLDNSLHISMPFAAPAITNSVDVLVPAKELYQAVKTEAAPNMQVRIHDGKFEVRANNRTLVLPASEPKNFPQIPDGKLSLRGQILASALETALIKALFCVSTESTRYSTDVLKLEMRDSVFRVVGTDGHRLSVVEGAAKTGTNSAAFSTLLLRSTASILSKLEANDESGWVQFSTCGSEQEFILFVLPDGSGLIARRGQGQFPNYENVIPKAPLEAKVVFQREELLDGLTKLSATARKAQNSAVKLELSKSPACIKAENDGTANRVALEHARVSGKARDIGLNHQYLTQYVKSLETDTVSMRLFPRAISEVIVFDSFRYQHLLMPLRD